MHGMLRSIGPYYYYYSYYYYYDDDYYYNARCRCVSSLFAYSVVQSISLWMSAWLCQRAPWTMLSVYI